MRAESIRPSLAGSLLRLVSLLATLLAPASALAQEEPIAIRYDASETCLSESEFLAAVRTYTTRWKRVALETSAVRTIVVRVAANASGVAGRLTVKSPSGAISEREILGPTCVEVSRALAVIVAVTIDPASGTAGAMKSSPPSAEVRVPSRPALRAPRERAPASHGPRASEDPRLSFDARVETTSVVVRGALPGIGISAQLDLPEVRPFDFLRLEPTFGLGLRQSLPKERSFPGGSVELLWTAGHARICPLRLSPVTAVRLSPCAEANIGAVRAGADGFVVARRLSTFWLDAGASVWATVDLSTRLFLSSTVLLTVPFIRQPIVLASGTSVATVPPLGVVGGLGLGVKL